MADHDEFPVSALHQYLPRLSNVLFQSLSQSSRHSFLAWIMNHVFRLTVSMPRAQRSFTRQSCTG